LARVVEATLTNAERILAAVRDRPGMTDAELRQFTGVEPHQQVNQICRGLEKQGVTRRVPGSDGRITNIPAAQPARREPTTLGKQPRARPSAPEIQVSSTHFSASTAVDIPHKRSTLVVIPCSGRKAQGDAPRFAGRSIVDLLPPHLAERLRDARASLAVPARLDESTVLPAAHRYVGTLYDNIGSRLGDAITDGVPFAIISGGYGLVLPTEYIGMYNRRFTIRDWPRGMLEECLVALVNGLAVESVIGFCARSTSYAELLRRVQWQAQGVKAVLATPDIGARGGAQVLVPRASGEALRAFLDGQLTPRWMTSDGVVVHMERLR
jgi:hypothetical protein